MKENTRFETTGYFSAGIWPWSLSTGRFRGFAKTRQPRPPPPKAEIRSTNNQKMRYRQECLRHALLSNLCTQHQVPPTCVGGFGYGVLAGLCRGAGELPTPSGPGVRLLLHDVFFFGVGESVDLAFVLFGQLLNRFLRGFVNVFTHQLIFESLIGVLIGIAADIAD